MFKKGNWSAAFVPTGRLTVGRSFTACKITFVRLVPAGPLNHRRGIRRPAGTRGLLRLLQAVNDLPKLRRL
jgi:hypothetical protein